ncbi:sulfite exporter TauE/SafE family protein [Microbispora sp. ATCC PTA-5024]|uniref:sulfite exporter TauE/SafE family protein n=1 Tax=Microbispora sp. ATCC PTA-5024 TaxID=316330 RepID=UPI0003DCB21C|nr:sulfite exporter TauE/SafE family protein [Microbispora sp. ATCC PTA-5024]ETK34146.1 permease [Microbispora sp. ATCC PTA-5024]
MHFDFTMAIGSFLVAVVVGLTGMGGGALMTPMLVTFFGVPPLTAVSSDLVAAAVMKPVGSLVHLRRGTVDLRLVKWLCAGSVPSAFCGVLLARALGDGDGVQTVVQTGMGVALLIAAGGLAVRGYLAMRDRAEGRTPETGRRTAAPGEPAATDLPAVTVRPLATAAVGAAGGLVVGMTSVGSGSLIIVALLALYPALKANQLVGTDLVQAVPLVMSAALGHLLFGDFELSVTAALLAGSIPGVYLGSRISSRAPGGLIRRALAFVLLASALKMFGVGTTATVWVLGAVLLTAPAVWTVLRVRCGLPALPWREARRTASPGNDDGRPADGGDRSALQRAE